MAGSSNSDSGFLPVVVSKETVAPIDSSAPRLPYADTTVALLESGSRRSDPKIPYLLTRSYPGITIFQVDQFSGTWQRFVVENTPAPSARLTSFDTIEVLSASREEDENEVVLSCLKAISSKFTVVMHGDGYHPIERVQTVIEELRTRREFVVCCPFASAYGQYASEQECGKLSLYFARKKLERRFGNLNDPFSTFFGVETCVLQNILLTMESRGETPARNRLVLSLLNAAKRNLSLVQVHYEPRFSPGYLIGSHVTR